MSWLDAVQWPAMVVTVWASWLVASTREERRHLGFWVFIVSNALWVVWGLYSRSYALIVLQVCLAVMNIRGAKKNDVNENDAEKGTAKKDVPSGTSSFTPNKV